MNLALMINWISNLELHWNCKDYNYSGQVDGNISNKMNDQNSSYSCRRGQH